MLELLCVRDDLLVDELPHGGEDLGLHVGQPVSLSQLGHRCASSVVVVVRKRRLRRLNDLALGQCEGLAEHVGVSSPTVGAATAGYVPAVDGHRQAGCEISADPGLCSSVNIGLAVTQLSTADFGECLVALPQDRRRDRAAVIWSAVCSRNHTAKMSVELSRCW